VRGRAAAAQARPRRGGGDARRVGARLRGAAARGCDPGMGEVAGPAARRPARAGHAGHARAAHRPRAGAAARAGPGARQGGAPHRDGGQPRRPGQHDPLRRVQRLVRPRGAGRGVPRGAPNRDGRARRDARSGARPARGDTARALELAARPLDPRRPALLRRVPQAGRGAGRLHRERRVADRRADPSRGARVRGAAAGRGLGQGRGGGQGQGRGGGDQRGRTRAQPDGARVRVATRVDMGVVWPLLSERVFRWATRATPTPITEAGATA